MFDFRNAVVRLKGISLTLLFTGVVGHCHAFDFKGFSIGQPTTVGRIEEQFQIKCGTGANGGSVCNGLTTVAGYPATANIVLDSSGNLQRVLLRPRAQYFQSISDELIQKFGKPSDEQSSPVQNGYGAQFVQILLLWKDDGDQRIEFRKYNGSTDMSSLYIGTSQDLARLSQGLRAKKGDL